MGQITIVGLGPGDFGLITLDTWDKITNTDSLILRTAILSNCTQNWINEM